MTDRLVALGAADALVRRQIIRRTSETGDASTKSPNDDTEPIKDVSTEERLRDALIAAGDDAGPEFIAQLDELVSPRALEMMAAFAVAQAVGVGEIADAIGLGMLAYKIGTDAVTVAKDLYEFFHLTLTGVHRSDLRAAGKHLAHAVMLAGVDTVLAMLAAKDGEGGKGKVGKDVGKDVGGGLESDAAVDDIVAGIQEQPTVQPGRSPSGKSYEPEGAGGEADMAFAWGDGGWQFLDGPSGEGGHRWNAPGIDAVAVRTNPETGALEIRILDNKANRSSTKDVDVIDDASALTKNLKKNITDLLNEIKDSKFDNVPRIKQIRQELAAAQQAVQSGKPLPSTVQMLITTFRGRAKSVGKGLQNAGISYQGTNVP